MSVRDYIYGEVGKRFKEFAGKLIDEEDKYVEALQQLERIRTKLEKELPRFTVSQTKDLAIESVHYGGIFEKETPGIFDIVIKINQENQTLLSQVLETFLQVLNKHCLFLEIDSDTFQVVSKDNSIIFKFENELNCRLHIHRGRLSSGATYKLMRAYGKKGRFYTSHLVSNHPDFFETQNKTSHDVANIIKFWLQSVDFQGKVFSDASVISELISSHSILDLESRGVRGSVFEGVFSAVCSLARMSVLRLGFFKEEGSWKVWNNVNSRHTPPFILVPLNSEENALANLTAEVKENVQLHALILKSRISKVVDKKEYCVVDRSHTLTVQFDQLFAPVTFEMSFDFGGKQAAAYVTLGFPKDPSIVPCYPTAHHRTVLEGLISLLTDVVGAVAGSESGALRQLRPTASRARLNRKVTETSKQVVKKAFPNILVSGVNKSCLKVEWYDTVLTVPYRPLDGMSVLVGFKWEAKDLPRFDDFMFY